MIKLRPDGFEPDFDNIRRVLDKKKPKRYTVYEFFWSDALSARVAGVSQYPRYHTMDDIEVKVRAFYNLGYDYANIHGSEFCFPVDDIHRSTTVSLNQHTIITDRSSFEQYNWRNPDDADYSRLWRAREFLPNGMKFIVHGPLGVLENVIALTGYDNLCIMLYDEPELVAEIFDAVGSRLLTYFRHCLAQDTVGAILVNDDWGFNSQTMLAPPDMRKYVFPWHKKIVAAAHSCGKQAILHSCGCYRDILDDVINDIRYDGRHSYEDKIVPVEQAYQEYNSKLAVMGGIDMDFMVRSTPQQVFDRARKLLLQTDCNGYALGTGNSVPEYLPDENFFALIKAIWQDTL